MSERRREAIEAGAIPHVGTLISGDIESILTPRLAAQVRAYAARERTTQRVVVREAVAAYLGVG